MKIEDQEHEGPPRGLLPALGIIMILVGMVLASIFVFRLQPVYVPPTQAVAVRQGVASIVMPPGVGASSSLDFTPKNATVVIGINNTIVWTNEDTASHTVFSKTIPAGATPFQSGVLAKGDTFNTTLTVPGVYVYYCTIHPLWMIATIVVKPGT